MNSMVPTTNMGKRVISIDKKQGTSNEEIERRMRIMANHLLDLIIENHRKKLLINASNLDKMNGKVV